MNQSNLKKQIKSIRKLPTLPVVAMEVNQMLLDQDSPLDKLVGILEKDPTLVMKILRLVNSSFYGFKCKIGNLRHAVTLLGYNTIRNAVISLTVMDTLALKKELKGFEIDAFWTHAIRVAVMSRHLAVTTRLVAAEDAFISGLLHDIGKVVLASYFPLELAALLELTRKSNQTFTQAEQSLEYWPHSRIGAHLARLWMLPETLVQSIKYHHKDQVDEHSSDLATVVNLSNRIVHVMSSDDGYSLKFNAKHPVIEKIVTEAMSSQSCGFAEAIKEMDAACQFFCK